MSKKEKRVWDHKNQSCFEAGGISAKKMDDEINKILGFLTEKEEEPSLLKTSQVAERIYNNLLERKEDDDFLVVIAFATTLHIKELSTKTSFSLEKVVLSEILKHTPKPNKKEVKDDD